MYYSDFWYRIWSKKVYWEKIVIGIVALILGILLAIWCYTGVDLTPATEEDYAPLYQQINAIQSHPEEILKVPGKIVIGTERITYSIENEECEMTGIFDRNTKLIEVTQKDKASEKLNAILFCVAFMAIATWFAYWGLHVIVFAIGILVITLYKMIKLPQTLKRKK